MKTSLLFQLVLRDILDLLRKKKKKGRKREEER